MLSKRSVISIPWAYLFTFIYSHIYWDTGRHCRCWRYCREQTLVYSSHGAYILSREKGIHPKIKNISDSDKCYRENENMIKYQRVPRSLF